MTAHDDQAETPKKFRLPSPGSLFLGVVFLLTIAGGLSIWLPHHREQEIIQELKMNGGNNIGGRLVGPKWLRKLIGHKHSQFFAPKERMFFGAGAVTNTHLQNVCRLSSQLPDLLELTILDTQITDEGLICLSSLRQLRYLVISDPEIGDEGIKHLASLRNLRVLKLNGTRVTPEGVAALQEELPTCDIETQ